MVEMYHYQSMWDIRQHPHLYDIFRAIHGTGGLMVSIDRVGLKPPDNPNHPEYGHKGMIHWDVSMNPAARLTRETRDARIQAWRTNTPPPSRSFPGDPRRIEERRTEPAHLTGLGRKLLGLDAWS
jgi:hypothetical protein